ncbi:DUF669 domain-containing protein [Luteolibacter pohnpeiensis]|uniref:DUF669 domain-containing protein n=1 Tax=Luteolibacter pohnpeiensis TaxID=454153 RepID=A0A934SA63_9BACT|nr:DUF669 domain-containing protein [Luteolibacter pohnpeiensis]MBK1883696.1 DUF669 domain-containing protein [Luteolibacter pohnpeiensis]
MNLNDYTFEEPVEKEFSVFEDGEYPFTILEINALTTSTTGNPMIPLKLEFTDEDEKTTVYENLVFTDKAKYKIDQFLKCVCGTLKPGRKINFEDPDFLRWLQVRTGRAKLTSEKVKGKDYRRNKVVSFVYESTSIEGTSVRTPAAKASPPSTPVEAEVIDDDDIPF